MCSENTASPEDPHYSPLLVRQPKMPIYRCSCGTEILIVPDLDQMALAISDHLVEHKKITGQRLSENFLTQEILSCLNNKLS